MNMNIFEKAKKPQGNKMFNKSPEEKQLEADLVATIEPMVLNAVKEWSLGGAVQFVSVSINSSNPSEFKISANVKNPESFIEGKGYYNVEKKKIVSLTLTQGENKKYIDKF